MKNFLTVMMMLMFVLFCDAWTPGSVCDAKVRFYHSSMPRSPLPASSGRKGRQHRGGGTVTEAVHREFMVETPSSDRIPSVTSRFYKFKSSRCRLGSSYIATTRSSCNKAPVSGISRHFFTRFFLMTRKILFCCRVFREMFRERPSESTKPFAKFNHSGINTVVHDGNATLIQLEVGFLVRLKQNDGSSMVHKTATHETGPRLRCFPADRALSSTYGRRNIRTD